ncbi:Imm1 family immunity protein [Actinoallomurus sp. NPDC052308]|uniref:Imm1 family immunity protein n=1 Tax=Actinoallomurus sp. NPDC052308 TaxID=3155530 RepID=UPI00344870C1
MTSLDIWYRGQNEPVTAASADDVDALIERIRTGLPTGRRIIMDVHLTGDPWSQGLDVGIRADPAGDVGVLRYSGREWRDGVYSTSQHGPSPAVGDEGKLWYDDSPFPADAELPIDTIREAVREFMTTGGARPQCITWQPG